MGMVMGMALFMQMLMIVGMLMVMGMNMVVGMAVGNTVVGVLMGVGMGMAVVMGMTGQMFVIVVHVSNLLFVFTIIILNSHPVKRNIFVFLDVIFSSDVGV
jgi:hypothetical protein